MPGRHSAPRSQPPPPSDPTLGRTAVRGAVGSHRARRSGLRGRGIVGTAAVLGAAGVVVGIGAVTVEKAPASGVPAAAKPPVTKDSAAQVHSLLSSRALQQEQAVSRSATRPPLAAIQRAHKEAALPLAKQAVSGRLSRSVGPADPHLIAAHLLAGYGWSGEYGCLDELYNHESSWEIHATNPFSGAYGIPQALPASKMASSGADWATNPVTQLKWGLNYIRLSYGTPCGAWAFWQTHHWY